MLKIKTSMWATSYTPRSTAMLEVPSFYISPKLILLALKEWTPSLTLPPIAACVSATILLLDIFWSQLSKKFSRQDSSRGDTQRKEVIQSLAKRHGGFKITFYLILRASGCLALFCLTAWQIFSCYTVNEVVFTEVLMCISYIYFTLLAGMAIWSVGWGRTSTHHLDILLFVTFSVYAVRDLWPLATTTGYPADLGDPTLLAKLSILLATFVIIPLILPRKYNPIVESPEDPPNPEQTAPLLSLFTYTFLNPIIFGAYKLNHLPHNLLPPLVDKDRSEFTTKKAFPHIDTYSGAKKRHLFFGLMRVFRLEFAIATFVAIGQAFAIFASPIALNRILNYLENNDVHATIKPWFWISLVFIGPTMTTLLNQWYMFIINRTMVRTEGLITQLVFDHSLRIRLKAEVPKASTDQKAAGSPSEEDSPAVTQNEATSPDEDQTASRSNASGTTTDVPQSSTSSKGNQRRLDASVTYATSQKKHSSDNLIGKINNLVSVDLGNIVGARDFLILVLLYPLQIAFSVIFLKRVLGWSAYVGFVTLVILTPVPLLIVSRVRVAQIETMKKADGRIQTVSEMTNILRMIKLFGWEEKISDLIREKRDEELVWLQKRKILEVFLGALNVTIPTVSMLITFAVYTVIMKQPLTAANVFPSTTVFNVLRRSLSTMVAQVTAIVQGKVSLDRVNDFLHNTELLDSLTESSTTPTSPHGLSHPAEFIGFRDVMFSWLTDLSDGPGASENEFRLRVVGQLAFKEGCINLIIGPTGSGKTSMLMALLGEMHCISHGPESIFNLPRDGGVAYAAQESWIQNDTIKENIIFGAAFDETRYKKVIQQCALEQDLAMFSAGDRTEVGERGITLSGGQKARITLARAVYSTAKILLLDDVLAALDVHTTRWIVEECFRGDLLHGRTVILVTHNLTLASMAGFVVSIDKGGNAHAVQTEGFNVLSSQSQSHDIELEELGFVLADEEEPESEKLPLESKPEEKSSEGKLIVAEEVVEGRAGFGPIKLYLSTVGGKHPVLYWVVILCNFIVSYILLISQSWFLGYWSNHYVGRPVSDVPVLFYLGIFASLIISMLISHSILFYRFNMGSIRASRVLHLKLVGSVLRSTFRWLDETPISRIITRCTQDISVVDNTIATILIFFTEIVIIASPMRLIAIIFYTPAFIVPILGVCLLGTYGARVYLAAQMSVKREMSNAKAPLLGHFGASIAGLASIRAYGAQNNFRAESLKRINHYTRIARTSHNLGLWIALRIDLLGTIFTTSLTAYLVYVNKGSTNPANIGFSLNMAIEFCTFMLFGITMYNQLEIQSNSLERIGGYLKIEHEPEPTESGKPPAAWPTSGELRVEKFSARYSKNGPKILHDISFHIKSGERIGIVGRTGSGKSSLTLALLRAILTEGNVYYDGLSTSTINLDALRSNMTIIPQTPELLSGSLRRNLDPFEQHDDATLNDALRSSGLFALKSDSERHHLTLDSNIASGGSNLSVGQRQIITLARAIVRGSKVLILDEATSAIDSETDTIIQSALRNRLGPDVTVLTVAHRLQTIMDSDRIMVLDSGKIAEFDTPKSLLEKANGSFKSLVEESGDRDVLYKIAGAKSRSKC